jgi:hypothetical protein
MLTAVNVAATDIAETAVNVCGAVGVITLRRYSVPDIATVVVAYCPSHLLSPYVGLWMMSQSAT